MSDEKVEVKGKFKKFCDKHQEIWKFIKFTFTGASTSILEMAVYMFLLQVVFVSISTSPISNSFLLWLGIKYEGYMWSYFISTIIGYAAAFIMNRKLTFQADGNQARSITIYTIMVVCTILINTWVGSVLSAFMVQKGWDNAFGTMVVKLIVMTIPTLWTYPLNRFVIHKKKSPDKAKIKS